MNQMAPDLQAIQNRVIHWAKGCSDLRAILVVGSQARRMRPADAWSDLDLMLFFTNYHPYLSNQAWIREIGPVLVCLPHQTGDGDPEFLVVFQGGFKVDFVFYTLVDLLDMVKTRSMPSVYRPGYAILIDKDHLAAQLPPPPESPAVTEEPTNDTFRITVETFWYGALYVAKQIRRENLWVVKFRDWTMKEQLLTMMEWYARVTKGWDYETWHDGHALSTWIDEQTWTDLHQVFGHFSADDSWRALSATMKLFRRLATGVAERMAYVYPVEVDQQITQLVHSMLD